jgi:hypothetical protein
MGRHQCTIFYEGRIREILIGRQYRHLQTAFLQGLDMVCVLKKATSSRRLSANWIMAFSLK